MSARISYDNAWTIEVLEKNITLIFSDWRSFFVAKKNRADPFSKGKEQHLLQIIAKFDFVNFFWELCQVVLRRQSFESELSRPRSNNLAKKNTK
jgi:hypothetical protein